MKNVTITLPPEVAKWARVWAAQKERSLSSAIAELLKAEMGKEQQYQRAMESYLAGQPRQLAAKGTYPSREELYDR